MGNLNTIFHKNETYSDLVSDSDNDHYLYGKNGKILPFKEDIDFNQELIKIYNSFVSKINKELLKKLELFTCPYCNLNLVINRSEKHTQAQLDHFFPKTIYPYLSLSLYNLIPSCYSCNHIKLKNILGVSPHDDYLFDENLKISYNLKKIEYPQNSYDMEIIFNYPNDCSKMKKNIDILKLYEVYNNSAIKNEVYQLINQIQYYSDKYLNEITSLFNKDEYKKVNHLQENELVKILFGENLNINELQKREKSKLIRDILLENGINIDF